jgi:hypothetical protein
MRKLLLPAVAAALAAVVAASAEPLPRKIQPPVAPPVQALETQMSSLEQMGVDYGPSANSPSTTRPMDAPSIGGRP